MKTRAVLALPWILAAIGILPANRIVGDEPPPQDPPTDYESWETANGITGAGVAVDSDGDGIPNGIEFVIGGDPSGPGSDSNDLLPTVTVDETNLYLIYRRTAASAGSNPYVKYSGNLTLWTTAEPGLNDVFEDEAVDFYEDGVDKVTVRIPRSLGSGTALFARLHVDVAP